MSKHVIRAGAALGAWLSLVQCNTLLGNESDYRLAPLDGGARECLLNSQCLRDEVCIFRTCSPPCLEDEDCANGARCLRTARGTACVTLSAARCGGENSCPEGSACIDGACRNECADGGACLGDQICTPRAVCVGTDPAHDPAADGGVTADAGRDGGGGRDGGDAGPCIDAGAEDCFNDRDDDCDGDTDCADSQCSGPAQCVPEGTSGAVLGTLVASGASCPAGFTARTVRRNLTAEVACNGCSCINPRTYCDAGIYGYGPHPCGPNEYQFGTILYNTFSDRCSAVPAGANVHYYSLRSTTDCTPAGTGSPPPPSWGETRTYCAANRVGGGCAAGSRCVPRATTAACALTTGTAACSAASGYPSGGTWYNNFTDTRTCSCLCGNGFGTCSGYIEAFSGGACTGSSVQLGSGAEGSACGLGFGLQTAIIRGSANHNACPPQFTGDGALTPTGPQTVCCR
jgi:hypothetical protein